ncbi:uncharacterized protein LOC111864168 isoform X1 [Cryptotermes secundus]|uniref:uncharacterized protein LOC111864168 isoform X1 n=1 Tax=Cryptotermes secundus TaxID=105785 RepID=UPI000CD7D785|nr:uncharacterized protein LOC111864168 isoform X1 [Cryptotermes secundus]
MTPFGVLFAIVAMTSVSVRIVGGYIEIVKDWGCDTTEFRLTCRVLEAQIAILDAFFTGNTSSCTSPAVGTANKTPTAKPPFLEEDDNETSVTFNSSTLLRVPREAVSSDKKQITLPVKHRCSGVNHCSFRLTSDYKAAEEWGPGVVFIKYACINHEHITKNCQQDITVVGEGFVETPGYPQFNVERNCAWKLRTQEGQRIQLSFLDISLRDIGSSETKCTDRLTVEEEDRELLSVCGEKEESIVIESDGGGLDVFVSIRSKNIFPKRGVLFQYKALGCPPLKTPADGYLVDRNASHAQYMCCVGFVFPDTSRRDRSLYCENGYMWTTDLPDCINVTNTIWTRNSSLIRLPDTDTNLTTAMAAVIKESDFIYDIILPTLIICLLLIGNGVIIFIIFYLRKRRKLAQQADDEELGAIFQPHDGSVNDKAISV